MTNIIDANNATAVLGTSILAGTTTISLINTINWPTITGTEVIRATIYNGTSSEIIDIDASNNITRAREGTTAKGFVAGALLEIRPTAGKLAQKQNQIANTTDVIDFGDATSLEIPNSAAPSLTVNGQIALDNTVTDYTNGLVCYRSGGTNYGLIAISLTDLASPTDTYVVTYDAALDKFKLAAGAGGGGGGVTSAAGTANQIAVSGATGAVTWSIVSNPTIPGSKGMILPSGSSIGAGTAGRIRFNTTLGTLEFDTGSTYYEPLRIASGTAQGSRYIPVFNATNSKIMAVSSAWVDTSGNLVAPNATSGYTTTATAAGTTTLTVASNRIQYFTGSTTQNCKLPVTSTLPQTGHVFEITNNSTGVVTVQSSGSNTIVVLAQNTTAICRCILLSGTTAASWDYSVIGTTVSTSKAVQRVYTGVNSSTTTTTQMPVDDTIPQNTEGAEFMSLAITPTSASNILEIEVVIIVSASVITHIGAALFQDSTASALAAGAAISSGVGYLCTITFKHSMTAGTTSSTTFKVRSGPNVASTLTFNGTGGTRIFGGVAASSITITEYTP